MLIAALLITASLALVVYDLNRETRRQARLLADLRAQIASAAILPDDRGQFRLMVPVLAVGGFADGEVRFAPLDEIPSGITFTWKGEGESRKTDYAIGSFSDGAYQARPVA